MADPLPYYRVLRDEHPVYYLEKWDTYALSRFDDIWNVLEINDGTFVASEGTLPAAAVLADHNDGPVPDPPLHPMPFHANFDAPIYDDGPPLHRRAVPAEVRLQRSPTGSGRWPTSASTSCCRAARFDLTQDYGGIVAASVVCELVGLPSDLAADVLATVNAGSLAQPGSGVEVANARPGYLEYLTPIVARRRAGEPAATLPIVDNLLAYRLPDGSALTDMEAAVQMLGVFIGGTETVPKIVAHGLWELSPAARPTRRGPRRPGRQRSRRPRGDDPLLRTRAVVRPHAAQAVHPARHHDPAGTADHLAARVGQPGRARVPRSRRVHLEPADSRGCSRSAAASTSASAPTSPAWRSRSW